ncbi:MAG: SGNH/GDSL hydrolase family protein [Verrucomicrobiales bacterium]|nr:SGNH/GDSL hydrolase family protein [Verrucomicrobiales bacterium]
MDEVVRARLERQLPRTLEKLEGREPVHFLVVGDGTTRGFHYGETRNQLLHAFPGVFARELAKEFFYTGGVKDLAPEPGAPAKLDPSLGPVITIERRAVADADIFYGFVPLTTDGFDRKPDLVVLHFGAGATRQFLAPADFVAALSAQVELVKAAGSDVILVGPVAAPDGSNGLESVAVSRVYAGLMRDVAQRQGVYFGDAGKLLVDALAKPGVVAEGELEASFLAALGRYFDHGPDIRDKRHLNPVAHEVLGERLAGDLLRREPVNEFEVSGSAA